MSSTNRSKARDTHIADYYVTPQKPIKSFLEKFCEDENYILRGALILDPCAWGNLEHINKETGEFIKYNDMSYPEVLIDLGVDSNFLTTNDLREDSLAAHHLDFTKWSESSVVGYNLIITNPPFNIAQDIIVEALKCCKEWGYVIMLLRLNYFWWKVRQEFWKKHMPIRTYVHNRRMGFTQDWRTDSVEYMHCVWKKWEYPKETKLSLIYDF